MAQFVLFQPNCQQVISSALSLVAEQSGVTTFPNRILEIGYSVLWSMEITKNLVRILQPTLDICKQTVGLELSSVFSPGTCALVSPEDGSSRVAPECSGPQHDQHSLNCGVLFYLLSHSVC